jgi:hypothetical protein
MKMLGNFKDVAPNYIYSICHTTHIKQVSLEVLLLTSIWETKALLPS